jgi:hypothetical protein
MQENPPETNQYQILWVEDEYLDALASHLRRSFRLLRAHQVFTAEELLDSHGSAIDLVLLDLMVDLEQPDLARGYSPENTRQGYRTGLEFYRKNCGRLEELGIPVLVYTILGNQTDVKLEFVSLGLPEQNFLDKNRCANVNDVRQNIERVLRYRTSKGSGTDVG